MGILHEQAWEALKEQNAWLEDVLAGLLINGVSKEGIEVQSRPNHRIVVVVRGEPKYEHTIEIKV